VEPTAAPQRNSASDNPGKRKHTKQRTHDQKRQKGMMIMDRL